MSEKITELQEVDRILAKYLGPKHVIRVELAAYIARHGATPEEITAQAESLARNYKPGPRQARMLP